MLIIVSLASAQLELVYLIPLMMSSRYKLWNYNSDDVMSFVSKMSEVEHFRKKCAYPCHRSGAGGNIPGVTPLYMYIANTHRVREMHGRIHPK